MNTNSTGAPHVAGAKSPVTLKSVTDEEAGQRIDNFLMRHFKSVPRSRVFGGGVAALGVIAVVVGGLLWLRQPRPQSRPEETSSAACGKCTTNQSSSELPQKRADAFDWRF